MPPTEEALIELGLDVAAEADEVCALFADNSELVAALRAASRAFGKAYGAWMSGEEL